METEPIRIDFATDQDRQLVEMDRALYGTAFIERGDDGLWRRIDPTTIEPATEGSTHGT